MKKEYIEPTMFVIELPRENVVTTSGEFGVPGDFGEPGLDWE